MKNEIKLKSSNVNLLRLLKIVIEILALLNFAYIMFEKITLGVNPNITLLLMIEVLELISIIIINSYNLKKQKSLNFDLEESNKRLENCYDSVRSFNHDFFNIMQSIGGYIAVEDLDGLKTMYSSIIHECQDISNMKLLDKNQINNPAIYHLINKKYAMACKSGIKMSVISLVDLNKLNVSDFEICRILGILLDNAIEATQECDNKYISLKFIYDKYNKRDLIVIENPCKNYLINVGNLFKKGYTTKRSGHGLGLWEVNKIAKMNKNIEIFTQMGQNFKQEVSIKET